MAYSICSSTPIFSFNASTKPNPGVFVGNSVPQKAFRINEAFQRTNPRKLLSVEVKVWFLWTFLVKFSSFLCNELDWLWLIYVQIVALEIMGLSVALY
ncbi:hypothetical protein SDJN02_17933 [Cucurbita argyrosperma subsp. argyrosperma]|nr:hypothetical protein SDJN02_17933 [Cucurbita argyrosperma subsp. argyrosperma]